MEAVATARNVALVKALPYVLIGGGLLLVAYLLKKKGGAIKTLAQGVVGEDGIADSLSDIAIGEDLQSSETVPSGPAPQVLATEETSASPGTGKPFVIPLTGEFKSPARYGTVATRAFDDEYTMEIELSNASTSVLSGVPEIAVEEKSIWGGDPESVVAKGLPVTLAPGTVRSQSIVVKTTLGNPLGLRGSAVARLKFAGRELDLISYKIR